MNEVIFILLKRNFHLKRRDNYILDTHFSASLVTEILYMTGKNFTLLKSKKSNP